MITVPVNLGPTLQGLAHCEGILELHDDALVLCIRRRVMGVELLKSRVQEIKIPFDKIEEVTWKTGMFGSHLEIRMSDYKTLSKIPNSRNGVARLKVARRYKIDAEEVHSICSLAIANSRIRRISDLMDRDGSQS